MSKPKLNRRLSSLDATFLYLEKKECPLHIGSTSIFDGKISLKALTKHIKDRLHLIPRYKQKVVPDPFNIAHPTWEYDDDFDIANHIFELNSRKSLSEKDLTKIAGEKMTDLMDREKPLWELFVINNLEGGKSAMISKVHHCMVDGISGVDLIKILFDISPKPDSPPPSSDDSPPPPKLDPTRQFFDSLLGSMEEGMNRFMEMQGGMMYLASSVLDPQMAEKLPHMADVLPAATTPAPLLPFNGECSGERRLAWSEMSFTDARLIKNVLGGTVNDVVLTLLSEAVSRYVRDHGEKTDGRIVRFMMPVSLRQKEKRGSMGNLISIIPVEIPLDIVDLTERFEHVNKKTAVMKETKLAESFLTLGAMYSITPAPIQSALGAIANLPFPPFNMVATNVPGPQIPLYLVGQKLLKQYPYVPVGYGLGLGCAIFSYNKTLYFGLSSDAKAMQDVERFKEILDETFADLKEVVEDIEARSEPRAVGTG
ncbi:MAG: wax ester/triacylglycerol synthase family O-acyltransferase [Pyrinomonadaceae bacterium]|nr:wax ester/triacylglycerol synthase family O-acyltransferase [Pyrinomonadaceae bacterium]